MPYCINCGRQLADGARFCAGCGTESNLTQQNTQRKTVYDGEIHKCPNCGEVLNSFVSICPACGFELRGKKNSDAVQQFATKLLQAETTQQKVTIIRNFPVPNTKEDILEFMILASSNIVGESNKEIFNAWIVKFEQCYHKAKLSFGNDSDFVKIKNIYEQTSKQITKERAVHGANAVGSSVSKFTSTFPNPIFGIVAVLLGVYVIIRIVNGQFAGLDIIMVALILRCTYKITNRKKKK